LSNPDIFQQNKQYFPTPIQEFQYFDKYSRWIPELGRREVWEETVERTIDFLFRNAKGGPTSEEWESMRKAMLRLEALPAMRIVQMAGPALTRDNTGCYNCAYTVIDNPDAFAELLYILMQGTGIGYSVEDRYVSRLLRVKKQRRNRELTTHVIPDTTEGWCDALKAGFHTWMDGGDIKFDYSAIRPCGTVLKTKGGRASGPQPLKDLLDFTRSVILSKQGKKLTPLDCHDIACFCGDIVQVGGVRRAALICLSDFEDSEIAECKNGEFWKRFPCRARANNSAVYEEKPLATDFMAEWLNLAKSGTGERGIFNREIAIPARRQRKEFGLNPCGEIILRPNQFCNLSIAVAREDDTLDSLKEKVKIASMFGTVQSTLTYFPYLNSKWKKNCEEERLLGVDVTGQRGCYLFNSAGAPIVLQQLKQVAITTNAELAPRMGINVSAAVTTAKPGGNSSQFLRCSNGIHVWYAPHYIRRVRAGAYTPVAQLMKDAGVPCYPETGQDPNNPSTLVFEFPIEAPKDAIFRTDVTAKDQFDYWLMVKSNYTEHNPSCTIYVEDDEWPALGGLVFENWERIGGLSFLPKDNHIYPLAPYSEITELEYQARMAEFPVLDWSKLTDYEKQDETTVSQEFACVGGACEL
jgi:ribonucleoside-diphosphate reductase alpha chain